MTLTRQVLAGALSVGLLAGMSSLPPLASGVAHGAPTAAGGALNEGLPPCEDYPNVKGKKPGKLLNYQELPVDPALLTGARMFRVRYTTSGLDETQVQATCGLVVMPKKGQSNQILAWAHGTVGVHQTCQPSNDPNRFLTTGAIKYDQVNGSPLDGIWQGLVDQGRMITATDYYSAAGLPDTKQQNYVAGIPAGTAVLDSVRTGIQLVKKVKQKEHRKWKLGIWGASQGGAAALWAGQLANRYLSETALRHQPVIKQLGVVTSVPASSFVANKKTPRSLLGYHLGDREMHYAMEDIGGKAFGAAGPILFSLVLSSWSKYASSGQPRRDAVFPGYPRGVRPKLPAVLTPEGIDTADTVAANCLSPSNLGPLTVATQKYLDAPETNAFFIPKIWGKPDSQGVYRGNLDRTCRSKNVSNGIKNWCTSLAYNMPGPQGVNPFPKRPRMADGSLAPMLIGEGMDDTLIYCQNSEATVPGPRDCLARQLYDSLATKKACRDTTVKLDLYAKTPTSPASHLSTMYQMTDNGQGGYRGSSMDRFLNEAYKGNAGTGCSASVVNK